MDNTITLTNQQNLFITGLEKVINICPTEIIVEINGKKLYIYGENMEVQRVDLENNVLIIDGVISCVKFMEKKPGFIKRIFK